jgi:hypothetical protein
MLTRAGTENEDAHGTRSDGLKGTSVPDGPLLGHRRHVGAAHRRPV